MAKATGGQELNEVERMWPKLGILIRTRLLPAINNIAQNSGVDPIGTSNPPQPPNGINVKAAGEMVHITIPDNNELAKGTHYFVEADNQAHFPQPHVFHLGASRGHFVNLPSKNDAGVAQSWYFRTYTQKPGSHPSVPVVFGGSNPIPVTLSGTTNLTPLASTGSGTANGNGQSGGSGFGKVIIRPVPVSKRAVGP